MKSEVLGRRRVTLVVRTRHTERGDFYDAAGITIPILDANLHRRGEFLENFDVQVSAGSISNILTHSSDDFEQDYHDLLVAGLSSTTYQQTDDTSARVEGEFWHTHILCNPFRCTTTPRS